MSDAKKKSGDKGVLGCPSYESEEMWHEQQPALLRAMGKPFMKVISGEIGLRTSTSKVGISARDAVAFDATIQLESAINNEKFELGDLDDQNNNHLCLRRCSRRKRRTWATSPRSALRQQRCAR